MHTCTRRVTRTMCSTCDEQAKMNGVRGAVEGSDVPMQPGEPHAKQVRSQLTAQLVELTASLLRGPDQRAQVQLCTSRSTHDARRSFWVQPRVRL